MIKKISQIILKNAKKNQNLNLTQKFGQMILIAEKKFFLERKEKRY